jgi:hypothetical protein
MPQEVYISLLKGGQRESKNQLTGIGGYALIYLTHRTTNTTCGARSLAEQAYERHVRTSRSLFEGEKGVSLPSRNAEPLKQYGNKQDGA